MTTKTTQTLRHILTLMKLGKNTGAKARWNRNWRLHEALVNSDLRGIYAHGTLVLEAGLIIENAGGSGWSKELQARFPAPDTINHRFFGSIPMLQKVLTA